MILIRWNLPNQNQKFLLDLELKINKRDGGERAFPHCECKYREIPKLRDKFLDKYIEFKRFDSVFFHLFDRREWLKRAI